MVFWLPLVAAGQSFTVEQFPVLDETASPLVASGLGAPTVAWDPVDELYVMFFETNTGPATPTCPVGTWAIGVASSPDGLSWEVWPSYAITPTAGTPYACVAAHPAVLYEDGTFHLWFKAEQGPQSSTCTYAWGCNNWSGVGYAAVDVALDDKTDEIAALEAEVATLLADLDAEILAYDLLLSAYDATLQANSSVFACVDDLDVCAPCTTSSFTAGATTNTTRTYCQPYSFTIPATIPRISGSAPWGYLPTLSFSLNGGTVVTCSWAGSTFFGGGQIFVGCSNGASVGSTVTADYIQLTNPQTGSVTVSVTLPATNVQTFDGALFTELDALQAVTSVPDADGTEALLQSWITTLQDLESWLDDSSSPAARALVDGETDNMITEAQALLTSIQTTQAEVAALEAEIASLEGYAQQVVVTPHAGVALQLNSVFGYPNVAKMGGEYVMLLQDYPDLMQATGATPTSFTLEANPVITAGTTSWAETEVYEPAMTCTGDPVLPYQVWVGGRSVIAGIFSEAGLSDALSADALNWALNLTPYLSWTNPLQYRHWDAIRSADGETRIWYTERSGGINRVGVMSTTTAGWDDLSSQDRDCD